MNTPIAEEYRQQAEALAQQIIKEANNAPPYREVKITDIIATALQAVAEKARAENETAIKALQSALRLLCIVPHDLIEQVIKDKWHIEGDIDISYYLRGKSSKEWANGMWITEFVGKLDETASQIMQAIPAAPHTPRNAQQSEAVIASALGNHLAVVKEGE